MQPAKSKLNNFLTRVQTLVIAFPSASIPTSDVVLAIDLVSFRLELLDKSASSDVNGSTLLLSCPNTESVLTDGIVSVVVLEYGPGVESEVEETPCS